MGDISSLSGLIMPQDPTALLEAATKQYIDDLLKSRFYPVEEYGFISTTIPIDCLTTATTVTVSTLEVYRIWVPANKAITGVAANVAVAGVTPGSTNGSGYAVYTDDGTSRLGITANDYTLFTTAGWRPKAFPSPIAAQTTGRFVRVAMLHSCSGTAPKFGTGTSTASSTWNFIISGTHRRAFFVTATTSFPTTIAVASAGTLDNPLLCLALY
jgi:hypothetical protein